MRANFELPRLRGSVGGHARWWSRLAAVLALALLVACTRGKDKPAAKDDAADGPVELDLWAGVPALTPEADDLMDELVPKPGPAKPDQVGEEIEIPFPAPTPDEPAVGVTETPKGPLEVLRKGPEGDQGLVDAIRVSFNHPMVPLTSIENLAKIDAPMTIEPAIPGEFRWMGTRALAFHPDGRLPFSTEYTITIPAGTESTHGTTLAKAVSWTVRTPKLGLASSYPAASGGSTHVRLDEPIVLRFNQPVDRAAIAKAITLKAKGKRVALQAVAEDQWDSERYSRWTASWHGEDGRADERARMVVLQPSEALKPATSYTVELPAGAYGEGPLRSDAIRFSFSTYPPLTLSLQRCNPAPCSASAGIHINASNQIRDARVDAKVHVEPAVENLSVHAGWYGVDLRGDFIGDTTYEVTIDAGLEDQYGQALAKPFRATAKLGPLEPELRVWPESKHPGIIEARAGHTIQLRVAGLETLEIMGASFSAADLHDYYEYNGRAGSDYAWPSGLGEPDKITDLDVSQSRRERQTIMIDVDDYLSGDDNLAYLMIRSNTYERWGYEQRQSLGQIVQVTNLGMTVALDRDDAHVLVTDLATGEPVSGATVKLVDDYDERRLWFGKTDRDGVARPAYRGDDIDRPMLVVEHGGDQAFMPINYSDLEGRYASGLMGRTNDDEVRAFMFTERVPYKPGETVHLVGILRKETRGSKGGVVPWGDNITAKYTVTSPRYVTVQEGEIKVGPFGMFSVDIETDENGDTGQYTFSMEQSSLFGSNHYFSHGFAVEAYRTPEFEVEVERADSTPLFFGDELEVEIRGRYLYGAPMIGADVAYSLLRKSTAFRPPGEGLSGFRFDPNPGTHYRGGFGYWGSYDPTVTLKSGNETLDADGIYRVTHPLAQVEPPAKGAPTPAPESEGEPEEPLPSAATFLVQANVTDENRQAIAGDGHFVVHPSAYYVGLRSERSVLKEGEKTKVDAVVVDVDGKRVEGVEVDLRVVRKETTRKAVEKDGVWTFEYATEETETSTCDLTSTDSPVGCTVTVGEAGTHDIIAEIQDGEGRANRAALQIYVHGKDAVVWDDENKRVDLVPDKDSYEPGETAKILVRSPFQDARGFLVIEREGLAQTHPLQVEGGMAVVEVEIEPEMVAGVTASAVLSRPRTEIEGAPDDQDLGAPAAASGQIDLDVSTDSKRVVVKIEPAADQVEPGAKLKVDLRTTTTNGKPVETRIALFVVDEGVLSLMGYQTPDPLSFFHRKRAGEVGLFADHTLVLPRNADEQPAPVPPPEAVDLQGVQGAFGAVDEDVWGGLAGEEIGEAYGAGGLGLVGTGRGGGGTGEGTIGLGNTGLIGKGGGGGSGSGYGRGAKTKNKKQAEKADAAAPASAAPAPPPAPGFAAQGIDANAAMAQEVSLRTLFATTAYFEADVETDRYGGASVEIDMPENLTSFRIMAVAIDPEVRDRFGSGEASVRVRKSIMLRPSLPRFLNMGDTFEASVMVDNQTEEDQLVLVGTRGLNVSLTGEVETTAEIPAGESREVRFPMAAERPGTMRLQFAALSNQGRDATEIEIPVLVPATKQAFADYGMTSSSVLRQIDVPEDALPGYGGLEISMSSTALNGLEDAVDYLVTYPYECSEQTASRILPIFALGDVLEDFPIADVSDRARRDWLAKDGIERLLDRQNYDGGFGYWNSETRESWPYVSTWVTLALLEGKQAGYEVDQDALDRALNYLDNYVANGIQTRWGVYYDWTSRSFALWLLSREERGERLFDKVWAKRKDVPLYARLLLASAAKRYGKTEAVDEVLTELRNLAVEDARVLHFVESTSEAAAADGLAVLMHSNTQTDAVALMTLIDLGEEMGDDDMAPKIMAGIMDDRDPKKGGRWLTTHANAWALLAASRYYEAMEAETPDYKARIWLDSLYAGEHAFVGRDMAKVNQHIPMRTLANQSVESVTLQKDGAGKLYYRLGLRYAPADFHMDPVDRGFTVSRRYEALPETGQTEADPEAVKQLEDGTWVIKAGTNVQVSLTLTVDVRANYVVVDDPLPAGFEGQNPRFLTSVGATSLTQIDQGYGGYGRGYGGYGSYGYGGGGGWWYPWYSFDHKQMRDDRMLLFADHLWAGVYTYSYTARATSIGTFVLPPVHAEAMYQPDRFGHGSSTTVKIVE